MDLTLFPIFNASLNGLAGVFLAAGWRFIKQGNRELHAKCMIGALISSTLFLMSYVTYHVLKEGHVTRYQGTGIKRAIYFFILGTHTPLAVIIVPFVIAAVIFASRKQYDKHTRITKWLLPVWLYVSVTGVLIYLMLYMF